MSAMLSQIKQMLEFPKKVSPGSTLKVDDTTYSLVPIRRHVPINKVLKTIGSNTRHELNFN